MAIEAVKEFLRKRNLEERILEFEVSSATVELAAQALGCAPERIAKSLAFLVEEIPVLVVAAGDAKVDNHKFRERFQTKAKMIPGERVGELTGHAAGGVCPFAVKEGVKVFLDASLKRFDKVYPACGSSNSAIGLSLTELEENSAFLEWVDVCKLPEQE